MVPLLRTMLQPAGWQDGGEPRVTISSVTWYRPDERNWLLGVMMTRRRSVRQRSIRTLPCSITEGRREHEEADRAVGAILWVARTTQYFALGTSSAMISAERGVQPSAPMMNVTVYQGAHYSRSARTRRTSAQRQEALAARPASPPAYPLNNAHVSTRYLSASACGMSGSIEKKPQMTHSALSRPGPSMSTAVLSLGTTRVLA